MNGDDKFVITTTNRVEISNDQTWGNMHILYTPIYIDAFVCKNNYIAIEMWLSICSMDGHWYNVAVSVKWQ